MSWTIAGREKVARAIDNASQPCAIKRVDPKITSYASKNAGPSPMKTTPQREPILVKRYARSRLYDTTTAQYLTADDLQQWKETGVAFVVIDTETGDDITRVLLA
jgi:hypothetical protein